MKNEPIGFDLFWDFWKQTKRDTDARNKNKLRDCYARQLREGATPEDILLAAHWHVRNMKNLAYIELAATWINSEAWRDEAPKEREYQAYLAQRATLASAPQPMKKTAFLEKWEQPERPQA